MSTCEISLTEGSSQTDPDRAMRFATIQVVIHAIFPVLWLFFAWFGFPAILGVITEMTDGGELPLLTRWITLACSLAQFRWYAVVPVFTWALAADFFLCWSLYGIGKATGRLWAAGVFIVLVILTVILLAGALLPLLSIISRHGVAT